MTPTELRADIINIASEMCKYPIEDGQSVYIKRSAVNADMVEFAVMLKHVLDKFCPQKGKA